MSKRIPCRPSCTVCWRRCAKKRSVEIVTSTWPTRRHMRTPPIHKDISYEKVATMALDMFVDTSQVVSAPEPKVQAVSAADEEETITPKDKPSLLESIAALPKIPWRIPPKVERGYEIPICVTENYRLEIGKFC